MMFFDATKSRPRARALRQHVHSGLVNEHSNWLFETGTLLFRCSGSTARKRTLEWQMNNSSIGEETNVYARALASNMWHFATINWCRTREWNARRNEVDILLPLNDCLMDDETLLEPVSPADSYGRAERREETWNSSTGQTTVRQRSVMHTHTQARSSNFNQNCGVDRYCCTRSRSGHPHPPTGAYIELCVGFYSTHPDTYGHWWWLSRNSLDHSWRVVKSFSDFTVFAFAILLVSFETSLLLNLEG